MPPLFIRIYSGGIKPLGGPFHIAWAISEEGHLPLLYLSKPQVTLETL